MSNPVLKISTSEETRYDFDVAINGLDENSNPEVRFVVESAGFDAAIPCQKGAKGGWSVCIPALPLTEAKGFKVEVIVEGYHFVPVTGGVQLITKPKVGLAETFTAVEQERPSVTASFSAPSEPIIEAEVPLEKKRLLEYADLDRHDRKELSANIKGSAAVLKKAAGLLETLAGRDTISTTALSEVVGLVRKSIASVEVKIYV